MFIYCYALLYVLFGKCIDSFFLFGGGENKTKIEKGRYVPREINTRSVASFVADRGPPIKSSVSPLP